MKKYAIIVAGGRGLRMGNEIPKQFLPLQGKPILVRTVERFLSYDSSITIVVVLPEDQMSLWSDCKDKFLEAWEITTRFGGVTRFQSVKSGLTVIEPDSLVAVHDGVRPLVSTEVIARSFEVAEARGTAIAAVALKDSIRKVQSNGKSEAVSRNEYLAVQTPQTFRSHILLKAYETEELPGFTDDASVVESAGISITLIEGSYRNIKITTPEDMVIAEALYDER